MTDFDTPIPRRGTGSLKWDRRPELDPFWVADMDFASAPEILEALHRASTTASSATPVPTTV